MLTFHSLVLFVRPYFLYPKPSQVRDQLGEGVWDADAVASQNSPAAYEKEEDLLEDSEYSGLDWASGASSLTGGEGNNPRSTSASSSRKGTSNSSGSHVSPEEEKKELAAALEPVKLLRRLLAMRGTRDDLPQGCKSASLDELGAWIAEATGVSWRNLHLKKHGKLSGFAQKHQDDFLVDVKAGIVSLIERDDVIDVDDEYSSKTAILQNTENNGVNNDDADASNDTIALLLAEDAVMAAEATAALIPELAHTVNSPFNSGASGFGIHEMLSSHLGEGEGSEGWVAPKRKHRNGGSSNGKNGTGGGGNSEEDEALAAVAKITTHAEMEALGAERWGRWFRFDDSSVITLLASSRSSRSNALV